MNKRDLVKLLSKNGFEKTELGKGSHEVWRHPDGRVTTVPKPSRSDYAPGTLNKILKDAGLK
ncbi:type II toxin-antitoxin system HicA family toxin [Facklamia hominis]|uniref:Addiction module toxin, HicA family n=1 Tax=Facklamia hominis CCUG 36813 TaxID=883111 RepID=K1MEI6_9LACT|nr:type II toxin-antitoxin system HicA family toxin [Facklamia hominis]EKB54479.1 hypothetical protein HMPREF9706_00669 [Facklamia hominis CCUG 36813]